MKTLICVIGRSRLAVRSQWRGVSRWITNHQRIIERIIEILTLFFVALYAVQACKQVTETHTQTIAASRPWVGPSKFSIGNFKTGEKTSVTIVFSNFGKSPALDVKTTLSLISDTRLYTLVENSWPTSSNQVLKSVLFPGAEQAGTLHFPNPITDGEVKEIKAGTRYIQIGVWITYRDMIDPTKTRHTRYCTFYMNPSTPSNPWGICPGDFAD